MNRLKNSMKNKVWNLKKHLWKWFCNKDAQCGFRSNNMKADVNGMNTLLDIYSYYVEQTSIWLLIADGWEIHRLVAELNGKTVGYEQMGYSLVGKIE